MCQCAWWVLSVSPIYVGLVFSTVAWYARLFVSYLPPREHVLCLMQLLSGVFVTVWMVVFLLCVWISWCIF